MTSRLAPAPNAAPRSIAELPAVTAAIRYDWIEKLRPCANRISRFYLKDADHNAIGERLSNALGSCTLGQQKAKPTNAWPVMHLSPGCPSAGKMAQPVLESDATPWADDLYAASGGFAALECRSARPTAGRKRKRIQADC